MAKRKINKTQAIRSYLEKHPNASPSETAEVLKPYQVTATYVSNVKTQLRVKGNVTRPAKKVRVSRPAQRSRGRIEENGQMLVAAATLIRKCGSAEQAIQAMEVAATVGRMLNGR